MVPTLKPGQFALVNQFAYWKRKPSTGEIAVFRYGDERRLLCKRVARFDEKKNACFFTGDNQADSFDSKIFGYVNLKDVVGKVITD